MKDIDLIQAMKRIKVQTGGLICLGCGHEHNCGVHGCAVIREAVQRLEELLKYKTAIDRMGQFGQLFVEYEGCPRGAMGRMCDATIQEEALAMDMLTDVDMGRWRPVNEDVLQDLLRKAVIETGKEEKNEEPAHIDRKAWKPCSVCGGKTTLYQQTNTTKLFVSTFGEKATLVTECMACPPYADYCVKDISANSAFKIKFCPECGRPLTEEARAEQDRLRELVEADREGRCKIIPEFNGKKCGSCRHFKRISGTKRGTCKVRPLVVSRWGGKQLKFEPNQSHIACSKYESALKGE